jgi:hypothetical protein
MSTEYKINIDENEENYLYLGLISIAIWENTDSDSFEMCSEAFTKW